MQLLLRRDTEIIVYVYNKIIVLVPDIPAGHPGVGSRFKHPQPAPVVRGGRIIPGESVTGHGNFRFAVVIHVRYHRVFVCRKGAAGCFKPVPLVIHAGGERRRPAIKDPEIVLVAIYQFEEPVAIEVIDR